MPFVVAFLFFLHLGSITLCAEESPLPNPVSEELLKEFVASSTTEGKVDDLLAVWHIYQKSITVTLSLEDKDHDASEIQVRLQTKAAPNGYLVMTRSDENGTVIYSDLTRYHARTRLFHRWRIFADETIPTQIFVGHPHSAKEQTEGPKQFRKLFWRSINTENPITIVENLAVAADSQIFSSNLLELSKHRIYHRESLVHFQLHPEPDNPRKKESFLTRLFGKKDRPPVEEAAKELVSTFEPLNFQFTHPGKGYLPLDPKKINPDASIFLINRATNQAFSIIVEALGEGVLNDEQLADLAIQNFKMVVTNPVVTYPEKVTIDGVTFTTISVEGMRGAIPSRYTSFLASHNGYICQLISNSPNLNEKEAITQALEIAKGFRFLDRERKAVNMTPVVPYENKPLGISLSSNDAHGITWDLADLWRQFPSADYGILHGQNGWTFAIPVDLANLDPGDQALSSALFTQIGLHFENDVTKSIPHSQGTASGFAYQASRRDQSGVAHYRLRVLRNGNTACLLCTVGHNLNEEEMDQLSLVLDAFKFQAPLNNEERQTISTHLRRDALVLNQIGLHHYMRGEYRTAIPHFERSCKLDPSEPNYFSNLILSHHHDGHSGKALTLFDEGHKTFPNNTDVQSLRPLLLNTLGRKTLAADEYQKLFSQNYRDEDDLLAFLSLLSELNRFDQAITVIDNYLSHDKEMALRPQRWQHQIYAQAGRTEEALALTAALAAKFPKDTLVQLDHIISLIDNSQSDEALKKIETALHATPNDATLIFQRGRAFQSKRDYQKAKENYEAALELMPDDYEISDALAMVSALLGQGDQSTIRTPINPVTLPPALDRALTEASPRSASEGFNSRTLRDAVGFYFKKGEPLRKTQLYEVKIFNQGGVEDYKTIRFEFDPTYERAFINQIEVTDENGTILSKTDTIESYVSDTSAQDGGMATTTSTVTATVPGLKPGCTLRYQFTIQSLAPKEEFPFYLRFAASGAPAGPRGFFVTGDFDSIRELSSNTQFLTTHDEHHRSWYLLEPARYYQESLLPSFQDYLPFLALGSGNTNWKTLGDEYLQELEDRLHPDPAIIELAQSLTSDLKDDHAKAAALVRHVQDRLVYQAIEFGVRGRIPERTPRILQNNYGDCKDHSLLIYQLLKSVNIPAHLALVNSSLPVIPEIPSLDQFDHMIVFAPSIRGGSFYDATAKNTSTAIRFPDSLKDSQALVLRVNASSLMTIPTDPDVTHEVRIQRRIDAQKAPELLTISEDISLHGSYADGLRHYMLSTNKAERRQMLEQILGRRLLISIKQLDFNNLENPNLPLEISITYTVSDSFQTRGEKLQSATPTIWEDFYFGVDQSGERRSPFKIQQAVKVTSQVSISLPDHLTFASPTWKSRESQGPGYSNELKILDDDSIQFILQIHPGLFEKEHFTEYSKGLSKSLQALQGDLRLQLPK